MQNYALPITWQETPDPFFPYAALIDGKRWVLRLNDFPEEPMFTLFVDSEEIGSFDDAPECWVLP